MHISVASAIISSIFDHGHPPKRLQPLEDAWNRHPGEFFVKFGVHRLPVGWKRQDICWLMADALADVEAFSSVWVKAVAGWWQSSGSGCWEWIHVWHKKWKRISMPFTVISWLILHNYLLTPFAWLYHIVVTVTRWILRRTYRKSCSAQKDLH